MKKLILLLSIVLIYQFSFGQTNTSKSCPDKAWFKEVKEYLDNPQNRQKIKDLRKWARDNNKPEIERVSNKLEYWVKDTSRYIDKYLESEFDAVCNRIMVKDSKFLGDFIELIFYPTDFVHLYLDDLSHYQK